MDDVIKCSVHLSDLKNGENLIKYMLVILKESFQPQLSIPSLASG